jgi:hypothetical protein
MQSPPTPDAGAAPLALRLGGSASHASSAAPVVVVEPPTVCCALSTPPWPMIHDTSSCSSSKLICDVSSAASARTVPAP